MRITIGRYRPISLVTLSCVTVLLAAGGCARSGGAGQGGPSPSGTSGSPTATTSASTAALPAGWRVCRNQTQGFAIGYPGDWFTTSLTAAQACNQFHPTTFTIVANSEYPLTALNAAQSMQSVDSYVRDRTDPHYFTTVSQENAGKIAGLVAIRLESITTGEGLDEAGTRYYGYILNRAGQAFGVWTAAAPKEARYHEWKGVVDQAVQTLTFS